VENNPVADNDGISASAPPAPVLVSGRAALEIVIALAITALVASAALTTHTLSDRTMAPTLDNNQTLLVSRLTYQLRQPRRGELVLVNDPTDASRKLIRRVVGLPGETLELRGELTGLQGVQVAINGRPLIEPYVTAQLQNNTVITVTGRVQLNNGEFFVMSDNRAAKGDSREWGAVRATQLAGRAWIVLLPLDTARLVNHEAMRTVGGR
jgi:signal peptidase I